MSVTLQSSRVLIIVKAVPNPSRKYGETVCCAGVTAEGQWKRLFPVRFRHLQEKFNRWDWIEFDHHPPKGDYRPESCHIYEERLKVRGRIESAAERARLLNPIIVPSTDFAASKGLSLGLIRPSNTRFFFRRKPAKIIEAERDRYKRAASQLSFFDKELAAIEPTPYVFSFSFEDASGRHVNACNDWETAATFFKLRKSTSEDIALKHLSETYNEKYPAAGMAFAMGTVKARPRQWLLLGVIRLDETPEEERRQGSFSF